jgi:hypothetical protein
MDNTTPINTVLSHLALHFASHPENIATEALAFILNRSVAARLALTALARRSFDCPCVEELKFNTQVANDDGGRPDLVGTAPDGTRRMFVEAKFWAGLTDAQPVAYLKKLQAPGSILLFVAPGQRFDTLWAELFRRCETTDLQCTQPVTLGSEQCYVSAGSHILALTSWRVLLTTLHEAAGVAGDAACVADINQLSGLCEQMDNNAFLPLLSEELTGTIGRRIIQFGELVDSFTASLIDKGVASVEGKRAVGGNGWYSRGLLLHGHPANLFFHAPYWNKYGESPLWLSVWGPSQSDKVRHALNRANIVYRDQNGGCIIPIRLLVGVEREAVIEAALGQLECIARALSSIRSECSAVVAPLPDGTVGSIDEEQLGTTSEQSCANDR